MVARENRPGVALPDPVWVDMQPFQAQPRALGPIAERAGGPAKAIRCKACGWAEIVDDEFFSPPSDAFKPPRDDGGFDVPGSDE